jgi:hypothetical protein
MMLTALIYDEGLGDHNHSHRIRQSVVKLAHERNALGCGPLDDPE